MWEVNKKAEVESKGLWRWCIYNTLNYWVSGFCPSSKILNTTKHNVSETGSVSSSGLSPFILGRKHVVSETLCSLLLRFPDDGQSPETQQFWVKCWSSLKRNSYGFSNVCHCCYIETQCSVCWLWNCNTQDHKRHCFRSKGHNTHNRSLQGHYQLQSLGNQTYWN
jgi:hypothetical protein